MKKLEEVDSPLLGVYLHNAVSFASWLLKSEHLPSDSVEKQLAYP